MKEQRKTDRARRENRSALSPILLIALIITMIGIASYFLSDSDSEEPLLQSQVANTNSTVDRIVHRSTLPKDPGPATKFQATEKREQTQDSTERTISIFCQEADGRPSLPGLRYIMKCDAQPILQKGEITEDGWIHIHIPTPSKIDLNFPNRSFSKTISIDDHTRNYVVALPIVSQFELLVVDQNGKQVGGAEVWMMPLDASAKRARFFGSTDADGKCKIRIVGTNVRIVARHPEKGISDAVDLMQLSHSDARIQLSSSTTIAWITIKDEGQAINIEDSNLPLHLAIRPAKSISGFSGGASPFALPPMQIEENLVAIVPRDARRWVVELLFRDQVIASSHFQAVPQQEEVHLNFKQPRTLSIIVENHSQDRLTGLTVFAYAGKSTKSITHGHSDSNGELKLLIPKRLSEVRLSISSSKWGKAQVIKTSVDLTKDELIVLVPKAKRLFRGRIVDKNDNPVSGARVTIFVAAGENRWGTTLVNAKGEFQFSNTPKSPFSLVVQRIAKIKNSRRTTFIVNTPSESIQDFAINTQPEMNGEISLTVLSEFSRHFHQIRLENIETLDTDKFLMAHSSNEIRIRNIVPGWYRAQAYCGNTEGGRVQSIWKKFEVKPDKNSHIVLSIIGTSRLQILPIYENTSVKILFEGKVVKSAKVKGEMGYNLDLPLGTYQIELWDGMLLQETRVVTLRPGIDNVVSHE